MSVSVENRPTRLRSAVAVLLAVLILVPAGYLFFRVWQTNSNERDNTKLEQLGVEYLTVLSPLVSALAEAESSALQGVSAPPPSLTAAVNGVSAVDQRVGDALGTRERWTGLREKIGRLPSATTDVLQAHVEVADLTLALYNAVRNNSTLVRDPDNDLSNLQQAVGVDLPTTVTQVSRMGDLALLLSGAGAAQQATLGPQFGAAVQAVNTAVGSLTDHLQAAVDDTNSATLSGNLVSSLDGFRRGVESLTRGANPGGKPDGSVMAIAQSQVQTALIALSGTTIREMTGLLKDRLDNLNTQRIEALVAAGALVLLLLVVLILPLTGRRRRVTSRRTPGDTTRGMSVSQAEAERGYGNHLDQMPTYGEVNPTRRERSGALR